MHKPRPRNDARATATGTDMAKEHFVRHKQPWKADEVTKLKLMASKGTGLKAIAKALTRSEESTRDMAKQDKIKIAKKR